MLDSYKQLTFHVPSLSMFSLHTLKDILDRSHQFDSPLLCLLACRWFEASENCNEKFFIRTENIYLPEKRSVIVVSDYAATYDSTFAVPEIEIRSKGNEVVIFSCAGDSEAGRLRGALNAFQYPKFKRVEANGFYELGTQGTHENSNIITVPMGCGQAWLPEPATSRDKVVMLDEVHSSVIDNFDDNGRFDVLAYKNSLQICKELNTKGYRILTFCRTSQKFMHRIRSEHSFIETIEWDGWMPFTEIAKHYAEAPLFFSHFHEAHGYPIYENLQLGNAVIGYVENLNPHIVRQFQNGVLLSSKMPASIAAATVDAYFDRYQSEGLQSVIAADARRRFSCETFVDRLIGALRRKGVTFS